MGRRKPVRILDQIIDYYANGKPVDLGYAFTNMSLTAGITTAALPPEFHHGITACANRCRECDICRRVYAGLPAGPATAEKDRG